MKKFLIFASAVACLVVSGCVKAKKDFADDQVSFSAITGTLDTRTDYGVNGTVGGQSVTYVNWVAGDKIKILSSTGSSDTYTVSEDHDGSDQQGISKGNVTPDNNGIAWGTGQQTFYAMYPANVSGSSLTSSTMTCVIPATWTPANETELGKLPYGYMFAKTTTSRTTSVSLTFNPKFTSFTFTLKNPTSSPVTLSSLSLSSASKAMNGTYTVDTSDGSVGSLPTDGSNTITVAFTSLAGGGLTVPAGTQANPGTKTFTLVAVPDTFSDLTVACTSAGTTKTMKLKHSGQYYSFDAGKKHNIAIELPDFSSVSVSSFTIYFGGTLVSNSSNPQNPFQTGWTNNQRDLEKIFPNTQLDPNTQYIDRFASVPTGSNHNPIRGRSDHIDLDYFGFSSGTAKDGIIIDLKSNYWVTPTKIEINCSATSTNSKIYVEFYSTIADNQATNSTSTSSFYVYSGSESANTRKTLSFSSSTTPPIPSTLKSLKILNAVHNQPVSIYYITVYY